MSHKHRIVYMQLLKSLNQGQSISNPMSDDGLEGLPGDMDSYSDYGWLRRVNHLHQNGPDVVLKAGDYFVGDINPISTHDESEALTGWMEEGERGLIRLNNNLEVVVWPTIATKRRHLDDKGKQYFLGHFLIGIIKLPDKPPDDSEKWRLDLYAQVLSKTMQGQIVHYEKEFSCSCYDGKVSSADSLDLGDKEKDKIRILNFGEQVRFTLSEHSTCEDMELYDDPKIKKIPRWRDENFDKPDDPLGNSVNFIAKVIHNLGMDPTEKHIEKLKRKWIWDDLQHKKNGSIIDSFGSFCEEVARSMGLDLNKMEDKKKQKLTDMIKIEFSRYTHDNKN